MNYAFYVGRIWSAGDSGFSQGEQMLRMIVNAAEHDGTLTSEEINSIIIMSYEVHKKLMEVNYNEGWK